MDLEEHNRQTLPNRRKQIPHQHGAREQMVSGADGSDRAAATKPTDEAPRNAPRVRAARSASDTTDAERGSELPRIARKEDALARTISSDAGRERAIIPAPVKAVMRAAQREAVWQRRMLASRTCLARGRKTVEGVWRNPRGAVV